MTYKDELGQFGENLACEYLVKKGYKIIDRNVRQKWGELDIIAKSTDKTLVFVEVKTMREISGGLSPENQITKSKLKKTQRATMLYAGHYPELIDNNKGWRIDLVAILIKTEGPSVRHYENIS